MVGNYFSYAFTFKSLNDIIKHDSQNAQKLMNVRKNEINMNTMIYVQIQLLYIKLSTKQI